MAFWNKTSTLKAAVDDWQARDLLDTKTAKALTDDIAARKPGPTFQSILILLAIICLGFGAITFVAANWDEISRQARVALVFGSMWVAWGAAIVLHAKSREVWAQILVLLACILFGAGIMLISQIYHIQGEPKDAVWLWGIGTLVGAALTRSTPALALAVALFTIWTYLGFDIFRSGYTIDYSFLAYLAICALLAHWMHSRMTAHLILLSLSSWVVFNAIGLLENGNAEFISICLLLSYILLAATLFSEGSKNILRGFERPLASYLVFLMGALTLIWYVIARDSPGARYSELATRSIIYPALALAITATLAAVAYKTRNDNSYDITITAVAIAITGGLQFLAAPTPFVFEAFLLAIAIWVIRMGWRLEYRPVTVLGFLGFTVVMLFIYFLTIGSLIGTSAFYLGIGILLLAGVFIVPKLMRKKGEAS